MGGSSTGGMLQSCIGSEGSFTGVLQVTGVPGWRWREGWPGWARATSGVLAREMPVPGCSGSCPGAAASSSL